MAFLNPLLVREMSFLLLIFGRNYFKGIISKELFRLRGTKLSFSSTYHPESDGQIEAVNHTIEMYLRCFVSDKQKIGCNGCYVRSTGIILPSIPLLRPPHSKDPLRLLSYISGSTKVDILDQALQERVLVLADI